MSNSVSLLGNSLMHTAITMRRYSKDCHNSFIVNNLFEENPRRGTVAFTSL